MASDFSIYTDQNGVYEDNPEVISKEEAITIASNKERELTNNEILNINTESGIRKLNKYFFEIEGEIDNINNMNQEKDDYIKKNEDIARNVWIISIKHKINTSQEIKEFIKGEDKEYYIDITTGEIIGGKRIYKEN